MSTFTIGDAMGAEGHQDGTVGKALDVLDMVASHGRPVRFSDLLARGGLSQGHALPAAPDADQPGHAYLRRRTGTYALGVRLVRLAHAAWAQSSLAPIARPYLDELAQKTGETIHLAQLDLGQVLYVDKRNAAKPVEMFSSAGKVGPAYCTGVGKAMLAYLDEASLQAAISRQSFHRFTPQTLASPELLKAELSAIRARGYGFDREEHEPGIICCAVPILTRQGRVMGALSVTSTTARTTLQALEGQAPLIMDIAARIAAEAESWRFPEQA